MSVSKYSIVKQLCVTYIGLENNIPKELYEIISIHSGQTYKKVWNDADRDYWMTAEEAKEYGMIDEVLLKSKKETQ